MCLQLIAFRPRDLRDPALETSVGGGPHQLAANNPQVMWATATRRPSLPTSVT